jgi:hypothetical protein
MIGRWVALELTHRKATMSRVDAIKSLRADVAGKSNLFRGGIDRSAEVAKYLDTYYATELKDGWA